MQIKIKKLDRNAVIPGYAKAGDAGMDLTATSLRFSTPPVGEYESSLHKKDTYFYIEYGTGLSIEIPEGYVGLIFPRSSISKTNLSLANSVGVIDSGYRGEIKLRFKLLRNDVIYNVGDKIGQVIIIPYPQIEFLEVEELTETDRGEGGFGHTGK